MQTKTISVYGTKGHLIIDETDLPLWEKKGYSTKKPIVEKTEKPKTQTPKA